MPDEPAFEWDEAKSRENLHERGFDEMTTTKRTRTEIRKRGGGRVDWARVKGATDADINKMIASDADTAPDKARRRDWRRVLMPRVPDVQAIRRKLGMSQSEFATRFGFSVRTVQEWEQGRALPDRPARILLRVIEKSPKTVERAVAAG
jgi:putative transcriptional regulator